MLAVSLVTLGSPSQLTGGYLYHRRMADLAPAHDAELRFVSLPDLRFPLPAVAAGRVLRRARAADVVLVDSIAAAFVAPALRLVAPPRPLVAVVHQAAGGIDHGRLRTRLQAPLDRKVYLRVERVVAASEALAADLVDDGVPADRVEVVPPGCDVGTPAWPLPDLRGGRSAALVSVGNWVARKGIVELLDAFRLLEPSLATLHLVGRDDVDPSYAARVRSRLDDPQLAGRVVVHGPVSRDRVATLLAAADAFVLPSMQEPYGTVYGEALAMGLPLAGWRAGNLPYLAEDGREAVLAPPGDVPALAAALRRLAADQGFRRQLADHAKIRGAQLPTWEETARRFFALVRAVSRARGEG